MPNQTCGSNETYEPKERRKRRRWLAAIVAVAVSLGLIAVACRHDGSQELTTALTSAGQVASAEGGGEGTGGGGEHGGREGSEGGGEHGGREGSGGGGEHGGGEGSEEGGEHGGGEGSEEGGEEASPSILIDQVASGNFNLLDYTIGYDPAAKAFRGVVENRTGQTVCAVRVEAHVAMNGRVIEFGPTPGVDLAAGETLDVVLPADLISPDAYAVHPESSPCT